jgi:hypothetical protein
MDRKNRFSTTDRVLPWIGFLLFGAIIGVYGQGEQSKDKDFTVQIAVEEVRIDAVVLDKRRSGKDSFAAPNLSFEIKAK